MVKDVIKEFYPLRYVVDSVQLCTHMGKERLLNTSLIKRVDVLEQEIALTEKMLPLAASTWGEQIAALLRSVRDISTTVKLLAKGEVMSEIELFELKYLAYYVAKLKVLLDDKGFALTDLSKIFEILDPCNNKVVNFYIYDTYDLELADLRNQRKANPDDITLHLKIVKRELKVRIALSQNLRSLAEKAAQALDQIAHIDLLIAKCLLAKKQSLTKPKVSEKTDYKGLFNIYLRDIVTDNGGPYQSVDIDLINGPTLITGANMSGKTMLLKSVALAQYMVQFGFYAPAERAELQLFDNIFISIGDSQHEQLGLSSFASEMLKVSHMVDMITKGGKYIVLLDELARTTSPGEGAAIVEGMISILAKYDVTSLITTHYGSLRIKCRGKRVRGFAKDRVDCPLTKENIGRFIDYSLMDDSGTTQKDSQAIEIAKILGVNQQLITETINCLKD